MGSSSQLFRAAGCCDRSQVGREYRRFFQARNGAPDFATRSLPKRDTELAVFQARARSISGDLERVSASQEHFDAIVDGKERDDALARWLAVLATANESEDWGVNYLLSRIQWREGQEPDALDPRRLADLEETYHTRALRIIVESYGIQFELRKPPVLVRAFIRVIAKMPSRLANMFLVTGEIIGTVAFQLMLEDARTLSASPMHRDLACDLLTDTLADEIGHVGFLLASMSPSELTIVRGLLPFVAAIVDRSFNLDREHAPYRKLVRNYCVTGLDKAAVTQAFIPACLAGQTQA